MLRIKSITDVITNSSNEVFLIKTDIKFERFKDLVDELVENCGGYRNGDGVFNYKNENYNYLPKSLFIVDIDHDKEYNPVKEWLFNNTFVLDIGWNDYKVWGDKDTGRIYGFARGEEIDPDLVFMSSEILNFLKNDRLYVEASKLSDNEFRINTKHVWEEFKEYFQRNKKFKTFEDYLEYESNRLKEWFRDHPQRPKELYGE